MKTPALITIAAASANVGLAAFAFYSLSLDMWGLSLLAILFILIGSSHAVKQIRKAK